MNTIEELQEEMRRRGCSKAQMNSRIVYMLFDIFAKSDGKIFDLKNILDEIEIQKKKLEELKEEKEILEGNLKRLGRIEDVFELEQKKDFYEREVASLERRVDSIREKEWADAPQYIHDFLNQMNSLETAEGRDVMRLVQLFYNSIDLKNQYDREAFIIGLSSMLSSIMLPNLKLKAIRYKIKLNE